MLHKRKSDAQMNTEFEQQYWQAYSHIAGVDEVGRGCLAGAVVAAAVVFEKGFKPKGILKEVSDSKQLAPPLRQELATAIKETAKSYAIAEVSPSEIDKYNILNATMRAMNQAVGQLSPLPDFLFIDGNYFKPVLPIPFETVIKGDSKVFSIAAASILAKVHRDNLMKALDAEYPQYGFAKHVGYATREHIDAIRRYGRCAIHRQSFKLKALSEKM
ncbi:MAG: ribonuclease HII [Chlorobiales bacterium]